MHVLFVMVVIAITAVIAMLSVIPVIVIIIFIGHNGSVDHKCCCKYSHHAMAITGEMVTLAVMDVMV